MFISSNKYPHILTLIVLSVISFAFPSVQSHAARTANRKVVGVVIDSVSGERLPFVNVYSRKAKRGVTTDLNGVFTIHVPSGSEIEVSSLGYDAASQTVGAGRDTMRFFMSPSTTELVEVVVKPKKQKYSKKNNPAVELMRRVRADRKKIDPTEAPYYSYDRYDKMMLGLNNYNGYRPGDDGRDQG